MLFSTRISRSCGFTSGRSAFTTSSCSVSKMSTAGAQGVRFDSSPARSSISPNTRLNCSCSVVVPRDGSQRFSVLIFATSLNLFCLGQGQFQMTHVPQIAVSLYVYVITLGHLTYIVKLNRKVDRKSTRLNSSHGYISYAVFCL